MLFTPTSCCLQGITHLSEGFTDSPLSLGVLSVPGFDKLDYFLSQIVLFWGFFVTFQRHKTIIAFYCNLYFLLTWTLLQLIRLTIFVPPTPHPLLHPLPLNQNLSVKAHSADKALLGWSKPKFVRDCILCSACLSMHVRFTAPTPTHVELSADAETSAQSGEY